MTVRTAPALLAALGLLAAALSAPRPAGAFERAVVESVAAVLPTRPRTARPQARGPSQEPEGSAVALAHGLFVTAAHVLGQEGRVLLRLADGRVYEAEVLARDPASDLALLESPAPARPIRWGEAPIQGAEVCAVGNAFGLGISVACGVVSQTDVTHAGFNRIEHFLQTDAATNPGMSGGALVNAEGRLVGVISGIFTKGSDANIGVNFAVSRALAERVAAALRDDGRFEPPSLGVQLSRQPRLEPRERTGARIDRVVADGPADAAGLEAGDLLMRLGDREIRRPSDAVTALALSDRGSEITAQVWRDGEALEIAVDLPAD
jgi:S1-C subfamily serine protease